MGRRSRGVMVKSMDCEIVESEFKFQARNYIHFATNMFWERYDPHYAPSYGLNSTTTVLLGFHIKTHQRLICH